MYRHKDFHPNVNFSILFGNQICNKTGICSIEKNVSSMNLFAIQLRFGSAEKFSTLQIQAFLHRLHQCVVKGILFQRSELICKKPRQHDCPDLSIRRPASSRTSFKPLGSNRGLISFVLLFHWEAIHVALSCFDLSRQVETHMMLGLARILRVSCDVEVLVLSLQLLQAMRIYRASLCFEGYGIRCGFA